MFPRRRTIESDSPPARCAELAFLGAHGGAGTSTLAALLPPSWDLGSIGGLLPGEDPVARACGRRLVIVSRNTVAAAWHATRAVTAADPDPRAPTRQVAALVVVADGAGPEPRDATARFSLLAGRVRRTVRVPFVPALRSVDDPGRVDLPVRARAALDLLLDLSR
ncbi:hypothetical protein [Actinomadura rayongensis]|uniref:Uncharacterized protein n=1 Tax=Actinomadura rayongensis TaxID=1429076 RepID=A0A6I4W9J6_9ACTN|nr:hypothetical protein [Actinomadura rayongensis]MXQ64945.1 hypothetical protein [Actinomadura rayongensis]